MPNVDERVVQMTFDNKQFEAGVSESLKTLDDLKKALNFDEVEGSLKNIENAFNNLNLSGLADSVDFIASRFEPLGKIADAALGRIADKVVDVGKKVADSFFGFSDMSAGQSKYETYTRAVQTITNATGKSVAEVEKVLADLQTYTDETSYDFAEMVSSIGKFTSAGIDLTVAEESMEGIANWAAKSGAGIQEANRAFYNLSQAISTGSVKLIDWKSIENANMATKEFKELAIQTAIELGVLQDRGNGIGSIVTTNDEKLKKAERSLEKAKKATKDRNLKIAEAQEKVAAATKETTVDFKNFNSTLSEGWLTSDVLLKVLEKYANDQTAYEAAQKALNFSEAIQAVKDALSSGWMESYKYIFGDLDEAKELWTNVANALYEYVSIFADWRNEVLKSWHEMGGYNDLIEAASNLWQTFMNIVKGVGEALANVFPILKPENMTQTLVDASKALKDWSADLLKMFGLEQKVQEEEDKTAEKAEEIAAKTDEITESTKEASQAMSGLSEATKTAADNLGGIKTGLKRGMRGKEVKELQKQLLKFGFRLDKYGADGIFGPETQAALKALQREIGVAETGIMDEATKAALKTDAALQKLQEHAKKGISIGARGEDIKKLQKNLNKYLGETEQLAVDGIFGPKTEAAIKKLQKELGLAQTGVWDQATKNALKTKKILLMDIEDLSKKLKEGMKGADVKKLQEELIKGGYLDKSMADGVYGPKTQEAVKKLQKALGIKETGEWDKTTYIALHNSQQLTRAADTTAKANKKISESSKQAAAENKKAAEEAAKGTQKTTIAMKKLQAIMRGFAAGIKIITKFAGSIVEIGKNIAGMFTPIVKDVRDFVYFISGMIENLSKQLDEDNAYKKFVDNVTSAFEPLRTFLNGIHTVFHDFLKGYELFLKGIDSKNPAKYNTFTNFLKYIKENYPILNGIISVLKGAGTVIGTVINFIGGILSSFFNILSSEEFQNAKNSVFSWIGDKIAKLGEAIAKFREEHPELTIENFINKIKEVGGWLGGKFGEGFDVIKNKFAEFKAVIDKFVQDHPEVSISNIFGKIKGVFSDIVDMFSGFFASGQQSESGSFFDELKARFKAFEPVLNWMEGIKDRIIKLLQSIFGGGEEIKTDSVVAETVKAEISVFDSLKGKMSGIQGIVDWFVNLKDTLVKAWNDLINVGASGGSDLVKEGGFTTVFDRLGEFSKEMAKVDLGKVISTALKAMAVYSLLNISNGIKNFGKGVGNFGKDLGKMVESLTKPFSKIADKVAKNFDFKGLSKALSERIKYGKQEKESIGTKVLKLAASLLMVVGAIALVMKVINDNKAEDVNKALGIVGGILVALGTVAVLMSLASKEKGKDSKSGTKSILGLCAGIYLVVLAIDKAIKVITGADSNALTKSLWIVGVALGALGLIAVLISAFSGGDMGGVKGMLSLCAGVYVLILALEKTISVIKDVDEGTLKKALWIVGGATALLGIFAVLISAFSKGETSGVKGLLSMCAGIYVLVLALEKTVELVSNTKNKDDLWSAVGIIGGMIILLGTIGVLMAALSKQPKVKTSIFKSLVGAVAVLVGLMTAVVALIAQNNAGVVWQALIMIGILLGGLGAIAVLMGRKETDKWTNLSSAAVFLSMAFMIEKIVTAIGDVIYKIKDVNPEILKWFFIGIDAAIGILAGLVFAFTKIPLGSILSADVGLLAFIGVLAAGMEMIGSVAADLIDKFSYAIGTLGRCLGHFAKDTEGLDYDKLRAVIKFVKDDLPELIKAVIESKAKDSEHNGYSIRRLGIIIEDFGKYISTITSKTVESANNAIKLMKKTKEIASTLGEVVFPFGKELAMTFFGSSLVRYGNSLKDVDTTKSSDVNQMIEDSLTLTKKVNEATWISSATSSLTDLGSAIAMYYNALNKVEVDENGDAIDPNNLNTTGMAQYISELANAFNEDDIAQLKTFQKDGKNDMYQTGYGITAVASALGIYADEIGGLKGKETEIELANGIINKITEINNSYDEESMKGFYNAYSGELFNGTEMVSTNIVSLAGALKTYSDNISNIEPTKVDAANKVIDKVLEVEAYVDKKKKIGEIVDDLSKSLTLSEGFTVDQFAVDIESIAKALGTYATEIGGLSYFQILKANAVLDKVMSLEGSMPLQPGFFVQLLYDVDNLRSFADGLEALGGALATYWDKIKDIQFNDTKQESANKILDAVADIAVKLSRGGSWISQARGGVPSIKGLTDGLGQIGTDLMTFQSNLGSFDATKVEGGISIIERFANILNETDFSALEAFDPNTGNQIYKGTMIARAMKNLIDDISLVFNTDTEDADSPITTLSSIGQKIVDTLSNGVTNANISGLQTSLFSAIDTSTFYASLSMVSVMNTLGTDLLSWIETGLKDDGAIHNVTSAIEALIPKITAVFNSHYETFKGLGKFINMGIALGIQLNQSIVLRAIEQVAENSLNSAKAVLGIASPSKVFMWIGEMIDKGLGLGILNNTREVEDAASGIGDTIKDSIGNKGFIGFLNDTSIWNGFRSGAMNVFSTVGDGAKNAADSAKKGISDAVNSIGGFMHNAFHGALDVSTVVASEVGAIPEDIQKSLNIDEKKAALEETGRSAIGAVVLGITSASAEELPGAISDSVEKVTDNAKNTDMSSLTDLGENAVESVKNGTENEKSTSTITQAVETMLGKLKTAFTSKWDLFKDIGKFINMGIAIGLDENKDVVASKIEEITTSIVDAVKRMLGIASPSKVFMWLGEMVDKGFGLGILNNSREVEKATSDMGDSIKDSIDKKSFFDFLNDTSIWDGVRSGARDALTAVGTGVTNVAQNTKEGVTTFINDSTEAIRAFTDLIPRVIGSQNFFLSQHRPSGTEKAARVYLNQSGLSEESVGNALGKLAKSGAESSAPAGKEIGKAVLTHIGTGILDDIKRKAVEYSMRKMLENVVGSAKDEKTESMFDSIGQYADSGIAKGLASGESSVTQMAVKVATNAYLAAKKALGIQSPSKEFAWIGEMADAGLVLGLEQYSRTVSNAAGKVADGAVDTATKGVLALSDVIGFNDIDQPVIRPVLDLSNIRTGAAQISGIINSKGNSLIAIRSTTLASDIATSQHKNARKLDFDSPKSSKDLDNNFGVINEKLQNMVDEIKNMKIYMDGNTLVGYVSPRVNRTLGHQATLAGRMN